MTYIILIWILIIIGWAKIHQVKIKNSKGIWKSGFGEKWARVIASGVFGLCLTVAMYHDSLPDKAWIEMFINSFLIGYGIFALVFDPALNFWRFGLKGIAYRSTTNEKWWDKKFTFLEQRGIALASITLGVFLIWWI